MYNIWYASETASYVQMFMLNKWGFYSLKFLLKLSLYRWSKTCLKWNIGYCVYILTTKLNVRPTFSASPMKVIFMTSVSWFNLLGSSKIMHILHILHVNLEVRPTTKVGKQLPPAFTFETSSWLYPFIGSKTLQPQILWKDGVSMESINVVKSKHMEIQ